MNDETTDNVPIVDTLPLGSNTATVEEQEEYLELVSYDSNNPADLPGYIPGQGNIIDHSLVDLLDDEQSQAESSQNNYWSGNENLPETTAAQDALINTFNSAPPDVSIEEEEEEEEEDEEDEEEDGSAMEAITDFVEEIAEAADVDDGGNSCCQSHC